MITIGQVTELDSEPLYNCTVCGRPVFEGQRVREYAGCMAHQDCPPAARTMLLERAESYARDSRTFGDSIKLGRPLPDAERWQLVYRIVADELRKAAASIGQGGGR